MDVVSLYALLGIGWVFVYMIGPWLLGYWIVKILLSGL